MRIRALVLVLLASTAGAQAATVVLKGGTRLDVASLTKKGNAIVVQLADGTFTAYPLISVDLPATRAANASGAPVVEPEASGPHSPFYDAQSTEGVAALIITDADVAHVTPEAAGEAMEGEEGGAGETGAVVLRGWEKKLLDGGVWEIAATIANTGEYPVQSINATIGLADGNGERLGSGTAGYPGRLAPGEQGVLTTQVSVDGDPVQVTFDFQWQSIRPAQPEPTGAGTASGAAPDMNEPEPEAEAPLPGFSVPAGSSPNTLPDNPMAIPPDLTSPPVPGSVPRATPPPSS